MPKPITKNYRLACHLYDLGLQVLPLWGNKRPAIKWKRLQTERCTERDLADWFLRKNWRPGIVTGKLSGIVVVDCDSQEVAKDYATPDASPVQQATKKGRHFVYAWPGWEARNKQRLGGLPLDVRGQGGYVVAYDDARKWKPEDFQAMPEYFEPTIGEDE